MKKLLLVLAVSFSILQLRAQREESLLGFEEQESFEKRALKELGNAKVNKGEAWFNYFNELSELGVNIDYFYNHLFPDSTVQAGGNSTWYYIWKHSVGQVLDPTSQFFITYAPQISKAATYRLDTVAFPYRYRRFQFGNPDTLIVQIFAHDKIRFEEDPGWVSNQSFANVPYNETTRKGDNPTMEVVIELADSDTISTQQGIIYVPVNMNFAADEKVAVVITYFPGNPFNVGDTIDFNYSPVGNRLNSVLIYDGRDNDVTNDKTFYNNGLWANKGIRYGTNTNGWVGSYIPGTAYGTGGANRHTDISFKLTFDDYDGVEFIDSQAKFSVYPNPASDYINFEYEYIGTEQAFFELTNIVGHKVIEMSLDDNVGVKKVDISEIPSGLYFYTLKLDGKSMGTNRLIKKN